MDTKPSPAVMHVPAHFAAPEAQVRAMVATDPFGHLVTCGQDGPAATATPFVFETDAEDEVRLLGHIAARNPQAATISDGMAALAIFTGPQCYISPRLFLEQPELPTWDYTACQLRGTLCPIDDDEGKLEVLARTAATMEHGANPWTLAEADPARVARLLPHIRGFRLTIARFDGARRLNQNKTRSERLNILAGLLDSKADGAMRIASLIAEDLRTQPK